MSIEVPADVLMSLCEGHFPGDPLVPGAYQLGLGVELASLAFAPVFGLRRAGFRAPLRPEGGATVRTSHDFSRGRTRVEVTDHLGESTARFELHQQQTREFTPFEFTESSPDDWLDADRVRASLRHEPPALFVDRQMCGTSQIAQFVGVDRRPWDWPEALDGAAQAAGLCLRRATEQERRPIYVAAYEQVSLAPEHATQRPLFQVAFVRRVMNLSQFRFAVVDAGGRAPAWLSGTVALAAASEEPR